MQFPKLQSTLLLLLTLPLLPLASPQAWSPWSQTTTLLTPWESIHQALHLYPICVDTKNWSLLPRIFTANTVADYSAVQIPVTNTIPELEAALAKALAPFLTQHLYGTTLIDIDASGNSANSTVYVQATHFLAGSSGQPLYAYALYEDHWTKTVDGWRIDNRLFKLMGNGFAGNLTILGG